MTPTTPTRGYEARHNTARAYVDTWEWRAMDYGWHRVRGDLRRYPGSGRWPDAAHYLARRPRREWPRIVWEMRRARESRP